MATGRDYENGVPERSGVGFIGDLRGTGLGADGKNATKMSWYGEKIIHITLGVRGASIAVRQYACAMRLLPAGNTPHESVGAVKNKMKKRA